MLDEQVRAANFAAEVLGLLLGRRAAAVGLGEVGGVILAHVVFQGLGVGFGRRLPFGFLGGGVEVVGQVFAVGVADFLASV